MTSKVLIPKKTMGYAQMPVHLPNVMLEKNKTYIVGEDVPVTVANRCVELGDGEIFDFDGENLEDLKEYQEKLNAKDSENKTSNSESEKDSTKEQGKKVETKTGGRKPGQPKG